MMRLGTRFYFTEPRCGSNENAPTGSYIGTVLGGLGGVHWEWADQDVSCDSHGLHYP